VASVRRNYPDFENAEPAAYRKLFPELSDRELIEKREVIFQFMEKLMGYEVAVIHLKIKYLARIWIYLTT
jgi:hypothetical protein